MKCKQVQKYILGKPQQHSLLPDEVEHHLVNCKACNQFKLEWQQIIRAGTQVNDQNLDGAEASALTRSIMESIVKIPQNRLAHGLVFNFQEWVSWRALVYAASVSLLLIFLFQSSISPNLPNVETGNHAGIIFNTRQFSIKAQEARKAKTTPSIAVCLKSPDCVALFLQHQTQDKPNNYEKL